MARNRNGDGPFTRARLETLALLAITVLLFFLSYKIVEPFIPALTWGLALAVVAFPLHRAILRRLSRPALAAGLSVVIVATAIVLPIVLITQRTVVEAEEAVKKARSPEMQQKWQEFRNRHPKIGQAADWARQRFATDNPGQGASSQASTKVQGVLSGTLGAIIQLGVALFALFFFLRDRRTMVEFLRAHTPLAADEEDRVFRTVYDTVYATVFGQVAVSALQGVLGGLMFWFHGIPAPMLWGVVMFFCCMVPVLGSYVVWGPVVIYLAISGSIGKAVILAAWGSIVIANLDNILYPILVGKRLRLHTLPVFLAVVGGLAFFGTAGIVLGPLVMALLMAVMEFWRRRTRYGQSAEEKLEAA